MAPKKAPFSPALVTYFSIVHLLGFYGIYYAFTHASWQVVALAVVYFFLAHLSITMGGHRLYAHASYKATQPLQYILVTLFSATAQGSMIWWAGTHRKHHEMEDTENDPHSPVVDGFFHSHMGWVLRRGGLGMPERKYIATLVNNRDGYYNAGHWQMHNYKKLVVLTVIIVPIVLGYLLGDWLGGLLVIGLARLVFQYHLTWVVNSLCHSLGDRVGESSSTNLAWLAIPTVGESNHSNYHKWPSDFRLGRKWFELDPGSFMIKVCCFVGLASDPVRVN